MTVVLEPEELRTAAYAGVDRRVSAIKKKRKGAHGFNRDDFWQLDIEGVCAEAAVAKALGITFAPSTDQLDSAIGDVGEYQVRSTKYPAGSLLIHDSDNGDHVFILVVGQNGTYQMPGWIYARNAKHPSWWKVYKGRGAFWVPQAALHPMSELPR